MFVKSIKSLMLAASVIGVPAVGFAQSIPTVVEAMLGGGVVPAEHIPASGNIEFNFMLTMLQNASQIAPGEIQLTLELPPQIVLLNTMQVIGIDANNNEVSSTAWDIVLDPFMNGNALITLTEPITAGYPDGVFAFVIPYNCIGPITTPTGDNTNWQLSATFIGNTGNILTTTSSVVLKKGKVGATVASLPIVFNDFSVSSSNCNATLTWDVAKEEGNESYVIERSTNGLRFNGIGTVSYNNEGSGSYSFVDESPIDGANFYRIRAVGPDGKSLVTDIKRTTVDCNKVNINVYPNPTTGSVTVDGLMPGQIVRIYDLTGRMMSNVATKRNELGVDLSSYPAAVYKLVVTAADGTVLYTTKVSKK